MASTRRKELVVLWKEVGRTPLQAIEAWKARNPDHANVPASYAGRLDPMAEGKLLVLLGDECKRQKAYHALDKEYRIEVLLDISSDTGDVLGMPEYADRNAAPSNGQLRSVLRSETGTKTVPYPAFSSKTVNGKPLFQYALEGTLDTIAIPEHDETIHSIRLMTISNLSRETMGKRIHELLARAPRSTEPSKVLGADFRQDVIRTAWDELLEALPKRSFTVLTLRVRCGSGAYMRTLADRIGTRLGTRALALSIRRTRIGRYLPLGTLGMWLRQYR